MIDCSPYSEKNESGWQMRAHSRVNARVSRKEMDRISEALLKAGINGPVHKASIRIRRGFG